MLRKCFRISGIGCGSLVLLCLAGATVSCIRNHGQAIESGGYKRSFRLHVSSRYDGKAPVPLLLALHQFSDTARGMEDLSGFNALADREGFIVVYPQGRFRIWNAGMGRPVDDVRFLNDLIDHLSAHYRINPARIYATGISAGAMMSQYFACQTKRLAAFAAVAGTLPRSIQETCLNENPVPALIIHGTKDPIIPYDGGAAGGPPGHAPHFLSAPDTASWWARHNGCTGESVHRTLPRVAGDDPSIIEETACAGPSAKTLFYRIEGGGHTWPGHRNWYPGFIVGPVSRQMDASELIWAFFKQYPK